MTGIIGRKLGMTQIFDESGKTQCVTVIEAGPCCVVQVKTKEKDGYEAVKLGYSEITKKKKINKPMNGVFKKTGIKSYKYLREYPMGDLKTGEMLTADRFQRGDIISVSGISKGKGFQGVMKRHNYSGGPGSHGSMFNRAPGSIGQSSFPSRVFKNKGMPGQMGSERVTIKNLRVVDVKADQNLILILGAVPGSKGALVEIKKDN